ncbi:MAG TPA: hypothetical protein VJ835_01450 [Fimbriimonadaceae bacterium]|nr:hypothetical protein [Fimbriimonadaceae bacterium]
MKRKLKITYTLLILICAVLGYSQTLIPGKTIRTSADISLTSAANKARDFLVLLDMTPGIVDSYKGQLGKRYGFPGRRLWNITTPSAWVHLDSQSGIITSFVDHKRLDDRYRGRNRTGKKFTTVEATAKAHLRAIATKLGVSANTQLTGYKMVGDGIGQDSNPMGYFGCVFKNSAGEVVATLSCDIQDGALLEYSRSRDR